MDKIINWWNTCNLEFQDKLNILLLQLANNNKESEVYKNTKQFLNIIISYLLLPDFTNS